MIILSIETSCDDTCISIMEVHPARNGQGKKGGNTNATFKVLANSTNSQIKIHVPYGGVFPMMAKREHIKNLPILLEASLKQAKLTKKEKPVDLIAVTYGPGLEPALWTGITFAQELAKKWSVPIVPVNHMEGHILSVFGRNKGKFLIPKINFPALSLLVSGGHTELVLVKGWMEYEIIGETLDDAVGEAFDKVARMLGLPYPGGPHISALAESARKDANLTQKNAELIQRQSASSPRGSAGKFNKIEFPRPMLHSKNFDFSFSGLKTAVLYLIRDLTKEHSNILQNVGMKQAIALEFENAAIECLIHKTKKATEKYKIKTLIVAGGVAANKHLQSEIKKLAKNKIKIFFPGRGLAGDNSLMIGIAGYLNYIKNKKKVPKADSIKATGSLKLK
jgi:N6-L-threonylcarbamoyladenine synthase